MVIQRWQSVLLLISVVLMSCFSFMSLGQIQTETMTLNFTALGLAQEGTSTASSPELYSVSTWYLFAVSILSAVLALIAIFTFKNLRLQKRLCMLSIICMVCVVVAAAIIAYQTIDGAQVSWSSLICAPFISLVSNAMAYQRISADQRIIRESERLR